MKTFSFDYDDWMKFKEMYKMFDHLDSFFTASLISELGFPKFTDSVPTAGITIEERTGDVIFLFNQPFYKSLSIPNLAFIFTHEMLHVAFQHWNRAARLSIYQDRNPMKAKLWNWACDCIVNMWAEELGFGPDKELRENIISPEKIGYPGFSSSTTSEEIYGWLLKKNEDEIKALDDLIQDLDSHDGWKEGNGNSSGNPKMDEFSEKVAGSMKREFFKNASKSMEKNHAEALKKKSDQSKNDKDGNVFVKNAKSQTYGNQAIGEPRHYYNLKDRVSTDVLRLIHKKIKSAYDIRPNETWMRRSRKLAALSNVILPTEWDMDNKHKYTALLVLDSSGSITDDQIAQAVRYARSFPFDKMEYIPISFDTRYYELNKKEFYDRNGYPKIPGRGGTDISLPERYINEVYIKKLGRRPDIVLIITDGDGSYGYPIAKKHQGDYVWILTKNHNLGAVKSYCPGGLIYKTNIQ